MFRRRSDPRADVPAWRRRFDAARSTIAEQRPPAWLTSDLADVERALSEVAADLDRLRAGLARLDPEQATRELKEALRRPAVGAEHERLIASLRERYESIHRAENRADVLASTIDRAVADVEALAARSVALGADDEAWRLDATVRRVSDDVLALEQAHADVAGMGG